MSNPNSPKPPSRFQSIEFHNALHRNTEDRDIIPVVARLSRHTLRLEREYQLFKSFVASADPECQHTVKVVDLVRLPGRQDDEDRILVSIFESPGRSYLPSLIDFGRAWFTPSLQKPFAAETTYKDGELISIPRFFDFAIGACECLELLHYGIRTVHGEIRGDAFHFNRDTGAVKLVNFGAGVRTFEGDFSSAGWSKLVREIGVEDKLQYIAPEQTGRMSVEPESRTDIYSLGIVFWVLLTRKYPFEGVKPLEVIHAVLNKRIPSASSKRIDIPDIVSRIVQKMTQKQIDDRYNSISGLKYDLVEAQRLLGEGDGDASLHFQLASKDVSSFFKIPCERFGRSQEIQSIMDVVDRMSKEKAHATTLPLKHKTVSMSAVSTDFTSVETATRSSDTSSQFAKEDELRNKPTEGPKPPMASNNSKNSVNSHISLESIRSSNHHLVSRNRHKTLSKCHFMSVAGVAGMGKSSLLQDAQAHVRKKGFSSYVKFDPANQVPYEPLRKGLSSLFRQIFSESVAENDTQNEYHEQIKRSMAEYWSSLSTMLDLPADLLGGEDHSRSNSIGQEATLGTNYQQRTHRSSPRPDAFDSSSTKSPMFVGSPHKSGQPFTANIKASSLREDGDTVGIPGGFARTKGNAITSDFPCGGTNTKQIKMKTIFVEVLRVLSTGKLICLCIDDLNAADNESLDLLASIIEKGLRMLLITTCSHNAPIPSIIQTALSKGTSTYEKILLNPFTESDAIALVSATLHRPREYVAPLALICLEKSNGNPFFIKHLLETAYRKGCIWFTWKESLWEYDLDKILSEFKSESYGQRFSIECITKRLQELPSVARLILAWGSLLGKSFSFGMVQRILSREFDYEDESPESGLPTCEMKPEMHKSVSSATLVEGLQAALNAYILIPDSDDDNFR